jgi:hypothetical protein
MKGNKGGSRGKGARGVPIDDLDDVLQFSLPDRRPAAPRPLYRAPSLPQYDEDELLRAK